MICLAAGDFFITVTSDNEVELISAILEWFDPKDYEKRFKY